jgi:hydroxymethylpyrimidine pyrophosphatase-like HAD family hydrolase
MIKLFVTDLDGCISHPFKTPDWKNIEKIRDLNIESRISDIIPPLTICTGRPYPYAEAVAQWLDVRIPFVFESAGLYHWNGNRVETALNSLQDDLAPIFSLKAWIREHVLPEFPTANIEFSKMMDAGIVAPEKEVIDAIIPLVRKKMETDFPLLEMHTTDISVNILMPGNNKLQGMKLLGESQNVALSEIAYIGDTGGDVPALKEVKMPFSPSNATRAVKDVSENLDAETSAAVLMAYEKVIEYNRSMMQNG